LRRLFLIAALLVLVVTGGVADAQFYSKGKATIDSQTITSDGNSALVDAWIVPRNPGGQVTVAWIGGTAAATWSLQVIFVSRNGRGEAGSFAPATRDTTSLSNVARQYTFTSTYGAPIDSVGINALTGSSGGYLIVTTAYPERKK